MEAHVPEQFEAIAQAVFRDLPAGGEIGDEVALGVLGHQAVEDQLMDAARRLVGGDAWVEVHRRALERHHLPESDLRALYEALSEIIQNARGSG